MSILEFHTICKTFGVYCSENNTDCKNGKQLAEDVFSTIKTTTIETIKQKHVTSQWTLWTKYTNLLKQKNKMSQTISDIDKIACELNDVLCEVAELGEIRTPLIDLFIAILLNDSFSPCTMEYFVQWLKYFLNGLSRKELPVLKKRYYEAWQRVKEANEKMKQSELHLLEKEALKAERALSDASFGYEHIVRELGHIYESIQERPDSVSSETHKIIAQLSDAISKFLIAGYSFELMDGDSASVPLKWVRAVMENITKRIGNVKVLALSVLGLQSSGKSTLLNTMFGLEFTVSAGRCTRGIFMQLLPVKTKKDCLKVDYIIILDTEGLRAPELADQKYNHDNELATFVIGLGDITIVNIKGENTAEVKDVLQIVVHAFLRLKHANNKLNLNKSCIFIHQNVSDVNASDKLIRGKQSLVNVLNEMTKEAAAQEANAEINSFNQVINFSHNEHIFYFSDLWKGDPPMAPANTGYSLKAAEVKKCIIQSIGPTRQQFLTISDMITHTEDLWNGILGENFVFGFRNSLEVKAYNTMEATYIRALWGMERFITTWLQEKMRESRKFENTYELQKFIKETSYELVEIAHKKKYETETEVKQFFDTNELREISIKWKQSTLKDIDVKTKEFVNNSKLEISQIEAQQKLYLNTRSTQSKHQVEINNKAEDLASKYEGKIPSDDELKRTYDDMWKDWVDELIGELPPKLINIETEVTHSIMFILQSDFQLLQSMLHETPLSQRSNFSCLVGSIQPQHMKRNYISMTKKKHLEIGSFAKCSESAIALIDITLKKVDRYLDSLLVSDTKFHHTFITDVYTTVINDIESYNEQKKRQKYTFTPACKIFLILHVFRHCIPIFEHLDSTYENKHGAKAQLESYKNTGWNVFTNILHNKTDEVIVAHMFCDCLSELIYDTVSKQIPAKIVDRIVNEEFLCSKQLFIIEILKDLASTEKNQFENFKMYISDSRIFASEWIVKYTNKIIFEKTDNFKTLYADWAMTYVQTIIKDIQNNMNKASKRASQENATTAKDWTCYLTDSLHVFFIPAKTMDHLGDRKISSFESFEKHVMNRLDSTEENLKQIFESKKSDTVWENPTPYQMIIDKLWGCKVQCPLCQEPCSKTNVSHCTSPKEAHTCTQHRPTGINGTIWLKNRKLRVESCSYDVQMSNWYFNCDACGRECIKSGKCKSASKEAMHPYTDYKVVIPDWEITPSSHMESSMYWMWFMATFEKQLTILYGAECPDIPRSWRLITKGKALHSLKKYYE